MHQLTVKIAAACLGQLVLLIFMYGDFSTVQWVAHKFLVLVTTLLLLKLTYQAFVGQRPVLALAAALASFPGLAFALFFLMSLSK